MQQALLQQQQMYHHPGMLAAAAMTQVATQSSFPFPGPQIDFRTRKMLFT